MVIDPDSWLIQCNTVAHRIEAGKTPHNVTPWFSGHTHPVRVGEYDRQFTDGVFRMLWDGLVWRHKEDYPPHWRQVGDYPVWRGLAAPH